MLAHASTQAAEGVRAQALCACQAPSMRGAVWLRGKPARTAARIRPERVRRRGHAAVDVRSEDPSAIIPPPSNRKPGEPLQLPEKGEANEPMGNFVRSALSMDAEIGPAVALLPPPGSDRWQQPGINTVEMLLLDHPSLRDMQLPVEYNPHETAAFWQRHPEAVAQRLNQTISVFNEVVGQFSFNIFTGTIQRNTVDSLNLQEVLVKMGPAFIKFGQTLSTRADFLDQATIEELRQLCFEVPTFPLEEAMAILEDELGQPVHEVFSHFESNPVAAASIGQVYRARLRDTGVEVAVKIQRPKVLQTVACDLFLIRRICVALRGLTFIPVDLVGVVDDFAATFFRELDYISEGKNADYFAWTVRHLPQVHVPKFHPNYSTRRVLVMDWVEGMHVTEALKVKPLEVEGMVKYGIQCYLTQLLNTGFFHGDPHPGNLICMEGGKLGIIDFGQMINVPDELKFRLLEASTHIYHRDYLMLVEDIRELGFVDRNMELGPLAQEIEGITNQLVTVQRDGSVQVTVNLTEITRQFHALEKKYNMEIPVQLVSLSRSLTMLEGLALEANPDFQLVQSSFPYILEQLLRDNSPRVRSILRYLIYGPSGVFNMQRFLKMVEILETNELLPGLDNAFIEDPSQPKSPFEAMKDRDFFSRQEPVANEAERQRLLSVKGVREQIAKQISANNPLRDRSKDSREMQAAVATEVGVQTPEGIVVYESYASDSKEAADREEAARKQRIINKESEEQYHEERASTVREAVTVLVADEFFREILVDEVVKGIDAVSRQVLARLTLTLGLQKMKIPLPIMGADRLISLVPVSPKVTTEDRYIMDNGKHLLEFVWKRVRQVDNTPKDNASPDEDQMAELVPIIVSAAADLVPEIVGKLILRMNERILRDLKKSGM